MQRTSGEDLGPTGTGKTGTEGWKLEMREKVEAALAKARVEGAKAERASIVAFLRGLCGRYSGATFAEEIEKGAHHG